MTEAATTPVLKVLVVGATGSIGRLVVEQALGRGHTVRALVRDAARARSLPAAALRVVADLTKADTLVSAVADIDAIVFTHGSDGGGKQGAEQVDYGAVRNVLQALGGRPVRIALMTSIGTTNRTGAYNRSTQAHDWKRRGERLVRASGMPYTIVRPGWFDYNAADQHRLVFLQGDKRHAGDPSDGVVARLQIAQVLVHSLTSAPATGKTLELVAERGSAQEDLDRLFGALLADRPRALDAILDEANMPLESEPARVREDYGQVATA
ncbi:SDR family oxidoreductase [Aquabacterium sp.]|uniref:SDR family oxidoreductase n=1 Tax=Aquabacterium sp. TaxID=1872578 RepID=UPI0025C4F7BB|nr:SDR family oxidoreductase [Aquabacterium sp.]